MSLIKLCFQNGHRNNKQGQTGTSGLYNGVKINEVDLIDKVFYEIKSIIEKKYAKSIQLYYDDASCQNAPNMDYYVALHFDGSTNQNYNGGFVDCNPSSLTVKDDWLFAQKVADNYFSPMGITFAPEHRTNDSTYYFAFNYTGDNTKQFLIELGTMTNSSDMSKIQDYKKIAELLMNGIKSHLNLKEDIVTPPIVVEDKDKIIRELKDQVKELNRQILIEKDINIALQTSIDKKLAEERSLCLQEKIDIQVKCDNTIADYKSKVKALIDKFKSEL